MRSSAADVGPAWAALQRGERLRFASEMSAFEPGWLPFVRPFPPGCFWTPEGGMARFAHAVEPGHRRTCRAAGGAEASAADLAAIRRVLVEAVESQMMGDVPVGVFLSGGLDSSLVAAIAARWCAARGTRLLTFAVGLEGSRDLAGVLFIDVRTGAFRLVTARAVLLATGGGPTMYKYHTPSGDKAMDGLAMALDYGLPLRDMEMVQFHPTGVLAGPHTRMTGTIIEEGLRGAGGYLLHGAQQLL